MPDTNRSDMPDYQDSNSYFEVYGDIWWAESLAVDYYGYYWDIYSDVWVYNFYLIGCAKWVPPNWPLDAMGLFVEDSSGTWWGQGLGGTGGINLSEGEDDQIDEDVITFIAGVAANCINEVPLIGWAMSGFELATLLRNHDEPTLSWLPSHNHVIEASCYTHHKIYIKPRINWEVRYNLKTFIGCYQGPAEFDLTSEHGQGEIVYGETSPPEAFTYDLEAQDIWISTQENDFNKEHVVTTIKQGWQVYAHFKYEWTGEYTSPLHWVFFNTTTFSSPVVYWEQFCESPESTRIVCAELLFTSDFELGDNTFTATADVYNDISYEIDENNNILYYDFTVLPPDATIEVNPVDYDFGRVKIGSYNEKEFQITNFGDVSAEGRIIPSEWYHPPHEEFQIIPDGDYVIPPHQSYTFIVRFAPTSLETLSEQFIIDGYNSNDAYIYLTGKGKYFDDSCFLAGTQITMADGSYKNIEKIVVGDMVLSCDRYNGRLTGARVTKVYHHLPEEMTDYYLIINRDLRVTPNHPLYINEMWKHAEDAMVGDYLLGDDGKFVRIESIEKAYERASTYNFDIAAGTSGVYTYIADGALVSTKIDLESLASLETMRQGQMFYQDLML